MDANQAATLINAIVSGLAALDAEKDADVFERLGLTDIEHIHEIAHVETPDQERRNTVSIGLDTQQGQWEIELVAETFELEYAEDASSRWPGDGSLRRKFVPRCVLNRPMTNILDDLSHEPFVAAFDGPYVHLYRMTRVGRQSIRTCMMTDFVKLIDARYIAIDSEYRYCITEDGFAAYAQVAAPSDC